MGGFPQNYALWCTQICYIVFKFGKMWFKLFEELHSNYG